MFGTEVTYLIGSEASAEFWSSHNDILNAETLYRGLTEPVFGKGVAYSVPHSVFSEQKGICKTGLTQDRFATYTALIEDEAHQYLSRWKDEGTVDFLQAISELIIFTATRCLHGKEVRDAFDETVAGLYQDLDHGFTPLAWFFPAWIPFPSFLRRDKARIELQKRFNAVIDARRQSGNMQGNTDLLETFMTARYQNVLEGRQLNNDETVGLLIALLMAGQHTSSSTTAWAAFFIALNPKLQDSLRREVEAGLRNPQSSITLDDLTRMPLLHSTVRETLRMRPPILTLMRSSTKPLTVNAAGKTYVIPSGSQVCVSPTINNRLPDEWEEPEVFKADRFISTDAEGKTIVTQGENLGKSGKFTWVPFGAGRHRCIGFEFAQIQIRVVLSVLLREFDIDMPSGKLPDIDFSSLIHLPKNPIVHYKRRPTAV